MLLNRKDFLKLTGAGIGAAAALGLVSGKGSAVYAAGSVLNDAAVKAGTQSKAALYDGTMCIGCKTCEGACKKVNGLPPEKPGDGENPPLLDARTFTRIRTTKLEKDGKTTPFFIKYQCMHCEHPACAEACIVGALKKQPDGPVTYDERKCIGCRYCQVACPFGIPTFEWDKPVPWIRKCTFCAERQNAGLEPACVEACPVNALKSGERETLIMEARARITAAPGKYVDYIYGEKEVGGTSWLYLSAVPFEKLGFGEHLLTPVTINAARAMGLVPPVLLGVAATMTGVYWLTKRKEKLNQAGNKSEEKTEVKQ